MYQDLMMRLKELMVANGLQIDACKVLEPEMILRLIPAWRTAIHDAEQLLDELADDLRGEPDEEE